MLPNNFSPDSIWITLIETPSEEGRAYSKYEILVRDTSGQQPDHLIEIVELKGVGGGIGLSHWEINWHNNKPVISLYLIVSMMGHDLDQWAHYDWETGERIKGYESPTQLAEKKK